MHASSIVALAFGATAASAAAVPDLEVRAIQACDPYCQFPESIDCPVRDGVHVLKKDLVEAARNGNREGEPREKDANNLATKHCSDPKFRGIPLWIVSSLLERRWVTSHQTPYTDFDVCRLKYRRDQRRRREAFTMP
jgi:hypothetical protein